MEFKKDIELQLTEHKSDLSSSRVDINNKKSNSQTELLRNKVILLFQDNISKGVIRRSIVKDKLESCSWIKKVRPEFITETLNLVRYLINKSKDDGNNGSSNIGSDIEVEKTSNKHQLKEYKRTFFTPSDNKMIRKSLASYILNTKKPIIKHNFEEELKAMPEMEKILEKFGVRTLIIKIRTERKKNTT